MVIDGFTLFGSWPGATRDHRVEELVAGVKQFKLDRACTISSKGIFFDAESGNAATWATCQENPQLIPIGVADPRLHGCEQVANCVAKGFRLMALFPIMQEWSPLSVTAQATFQCIADANLPLLIEAGRDGDATMVLEATRQYSNPVILLDVSPSTLTEAISVVKLRPKTFLATRLLCGGDTIEFLVQALGAECLIFSSRFPASCFSSAFLTAKFANIAEKDQRAIMGENMGRLLGF